MTVSVVFFLLLAPHLGSSLTCLSCQNGYHSDTPCSTHVPRGMSEVCASPNAECFTVIEWFQNGAIQLVRRGCWSPTNSSNPGGFCRNYDRRIGAMKDCASCKTDFCNERKVYQQPISHCRSYL